MRAFGFRRRRWTTDGGESARFSISTLPSSLARLEALEAIGEILPVVVCVLRMYIGNLFRFGLLNDISRMSIH
jgi:hypothetical protein